jgi:hypothetical protein
MFNLLYLAPITLLLQGTRIDMGVLVARSTLAVPHGACASSSGRLAPWASTKAGDWTTLTELSCLLTHPCRRTLSGLFSTSITSKVLRYLRGGRLRAPRVASSLRSAGWTSRSKITAMTAVFMLTFVDFEVCH